MKTSDKLDQIGIAISKMQSQLECAKKSSTNPFFHSKYADLKEVWAVVQKPLTDNGLFLIQSVNVDSHNKFQASMPIKNRTGDIIGVRDVLMVWVTITTRVQHNVSEQFFEDSVCLPCEADPQLIGKTITYIRRYSMMPMLGVAPEDDDGESAAGRGDAVKQNSFPPTNIPRPKGQPSPPVAKTISFSQGKRFVAIARERGWQDDEARKMLIAHGIAEDPKIWGMILSIPYSKYETFISILEAGGQPPSTDGTGKQE